MVDVDRLEDLDTAKAFAKLVIDENELLRKKVSELAHAVARLEGRGEGEQVELQLGELKEQLGALAHRLFGDSTERRPKPKAAKATGKRRGHGPRAQPNLPLKEVVEVLDDDARCCPKCDGRLEPMAGQTEDSEYIVRIEAKYALVREFREKYRCRCNESIVTAPSMSTRLVKGGRYDVSFGVGVVVDKYVDHMPLERQVRAMSRRGLVIDSQTLWDQVALVAHHNAHNYLALRDYIVSADVVGADETWWRLMGGKSKTRWWAWGLTTNDACWYDFAPSRSAEMAKKLLSGFEGTVLCDGYKAYETVAKELPNIRLAHCWAHARRNFVEAERNYPDACGQALAMIGELFEIERKLEDPDPLEGDAKAAATRRRKKIRDAESRPVLEKLRGWALEQYGLPKSGLRKAIEYLLTYWNGLTAFVDDPHLAIHNNRTERALRGMVVGRKNHYGSRSEAGTRAAAILYSLVESAKLSGVDPALYLDMATRLSIQKPGRVLLPHQLAAASI